MATILPFQPRDRQFASSRETAAQEAAQELATDHDELARAAADAADRFGEIVLFTGVRYSRWDEQAGEAGVELAPAE